MFNLGQHPINKIPILSMLTFKQYLAANLVLKPAHTHYTLHIQPKDLISSEKSQRNLEREETGSQPSTKDLKRKKKELTLSITKRQISKERLEGGDK